MILPDILAGPIVRRVSAQAIHVWICTSKPLDLGIAIYATKTDKQKQPFEEVRPEIGRGKAVRCLCLGRKLFIHLLKAVPVGSKMTGTGLLPLGALLAYDICTFSSANPEKLGASILTPELRQAISLTGEKVLPTIVLQKNDESDLRALFTSCRKLHGPGRDAFVSVFADRYKQPYVVPPNRPNVLMLMGDQIYADDVSAFLLNRLEELSRELVGFQEAIPDEKGSVLSKWKYGAGQRQAGISDAACFTSEEGANHLARFGEFAAMYLLSWSANENLWPSDTLGRMETQAKRDKAAQRTYPVLPDRGDRNPKTGNDFAKQNRAKDWLDELGRLKDALAGSLVLRKILANTPTYMIFDDHDVTDDWNLTPAWKASVEANPMGRRIVSNALAAYTVFQGWGNDPASFEESEMLDSIEERFATCDSVAIGKYEKQLLSFEKWSFIAPTVPPALFVDSRTRRTRTPSISELGFSGEEHLPIYFTKKLIKTDSGLDYFVPILIDAIAVERLKALSAALAGQRLILVTPSPVFDVPWIEAGKDVLLKNMLLTAAEADLEAWMTNKHSFMRLLQVLTSIKSLEEVVMLSGDVHYAFSVSGQMELGDRQLRVRLFNSSAAKNRPDKGQYVTARWLGKMSQDLDQAKQSAYLWEDDKNRINIRSSWRFESPLSQGFNLPKKQHKNQVKLVTECRPLRINGVQGEDLVVADCNVGYLSIDKATNLVSSNLIVRR